MLVLTLKAGEKLVIGDDTVVSVEMVGEGKARVGVCCPKARLVRRGKHLTPDEWSDVSRKAAEGHAPKPEGR